MFPAFRAGDIILYYLNESLVSYLILERECLTILSDPAGVQEGTHPTHYEHRSKTSNSNN
uniref:Uncharacterized protein n=1 Tax=Romanomermis culicivorax TaxID=13658 RepID=A0A915K860_ROMCU